jgi:hypothetical protein
MANKIQLRRDTAANWQSSNPTLAQGEVGIDLTNNKIKIGNGTTAWNGLPYFDDKETVFTAVNSSVIPSTDNVYDLGSPTKQWRHAYISEGSLYIGNIKITNEMGKLVVTTVENPGLENESPIEGGEDAYQLPVASGSVVGGIKVGSNLTISEDGTLSAEDGNYVLPIASSTVLGGIKIGDNLTIDENGKLDAVQADLSGYATEEYVDEAVSAIEIPQDIGDLTDTEGLLGQGSGDTGDITFNGTTISAPNDDAIRIEAKDENGDLRAYFKADPADGQAEMRALSSPIRTNFSLAGSDWQSAQWVESGGQGYLEFTNAPNIIEYFNNTPSNQYIRINGGEPVMRDGGGSRSDNDISIPTSVFPPSTTVVTTVEFYYMNESRVEINNGGDMNINIYGDQLDIDIESTESVTVIGSDIDISAYTTLKLQNYASDQSIEIITNGDDDQRIWNFGVDGSLTLPEGGDILDSEGNSVLGGGGANTGDITFTDATISAGTNDEVIVQAQDDNGFATARLNLEPEYSTARLSAFSSESVDTYTLANGDFATGVWQDNGFGNGLVSFTDAQNIGDFFQNTLQSLTSENVFITINSEPAFAWNGGAGGAGTSTPSFGTNPIVPESPITITSITFTYRSESYISVNYDNQEIRLDAQNAGIRMDATNSIRMFGDSNIELQAETTFRIAAGEDIDIGTGSSYTVRISGGDFSVSASDDINIRGNDVFRLRNESTTEPIQIITDDDDNEYTWAFNADGTLTFPDATVQTTAYTGSAGGTATDIVNTTSAEVRVGSNGYEVEFVGFISNGFGDDSGATLTVTEIISGTITDGMTIYGEGLPEEGWVLTFNSGLIAPVGTGGTGNYLLSGANYLISSQSFNNNVLVDTKVWTFGVGGILEFPTADLFADPLELPAIHFPVPESQGGYVGVTPNGLGIAVDVNTWQFGLTGSLSLPNGGIIAEGVVTENPTIELTPAGPDDTSQRLVIKGGFPIGEDYHLHLTTGDLATTSIILGVDDHNVRTTTDSEIEITTPGGEDGTHVWRFAADGTTYLAKNSSSPISYLSTPQNDDNIDLELQVGKDFYINTAEFGNDTKQTWKFDTDGTLAVPGNIVFGGERSDVEGAVPMGSISAEFDEETEYETLVIRGSDELRLTTINGGDVLKFGNAGLTFPDGTTQTTAYQTTTAPATSKGVAGDKQGMIAVDNTYFYVCTADWTDGVADIWSRNPLASGTW